MLANRSSSRWIASKISEILGNEDDVVIELCFNLLEGSRYVCSYPCIPSTRHLAYSILAQYQSTSDSAHGLPGQGHSQLLQGALESLSKRSVKRSRGAEGASGSEEAGTNSGEGTLIWRHLCIYI